MLRCYALPAPVNKRSGWLRFEDCIVSVLGYRAAFVYDNGGLLNSTVFGYLVLLDLIYLAVM